MCVDLMHFLPGLSYEEIKEMDWPDLSAWYDTVMDRYGPTE
jgi:hypothetical protein